MRKCLPSYPLLIAPILLWGGLLSLSVVGPGCSSTTSVAPVAADTNVLIKVLKSGPVYDSLGRDTTSPTFIHPETVALRDTVANDSSSVIVNYEGRLLDGRVFDSSYGRGIPFKTNLRTGSIITGWKKGIQGKTISIPSPGRGMRHGDIWQLTIPASLAYGSTGSGIIAGGDTIVFKIEMLKVYPPGQN